MLFSLLQMCFEIEKMGFYFPGRPGKIKVLEKCVSLDANFAVNRKNLRMTKFTP